MKPSPPPIELPHIYSNWEAGLIEDLERLSGLTRVNVYCEFQRNGLIGTHFLVYCTINPFLPSGLERVVIRVGLGPAGMNDRFKNLASELVQLTCKVGQAIAVVHISEMWSFKADTEADEKRLKAWRAAHNGSFEGCPGVKDVVGAWVETRSAQRRYHAPILHGDGGKRWLGAWTKLPDPDLMMGRFTNFLTHIAHTEAEA